ncbi:ABC transporter substrate-binding protein [Streptomyces synnematoformans]|uniref:ABC transporter substrate-binding protein n=1 Tax=Streptomyces synnematoformans TaxID=415721 RepID=A0ABP4KBE7_9ACTN
MRARLRGPVSRLSRLLRLSLPAALLFAAACGGPAREDGGGGASSPPGFPVTVDNCGVETVYERPPRRAVTLNQHVTEIMLALGLEKSMAGTGYLDDEVLPAYREAYDGIDVIADEYPSYETLLAAEPDFVYGGFASAFEEGRGRDALAGAGIDSYLSLEECADPPVTVDLLDREIRTVAEVFGVPRRAEKLLGEAHATLAAVREAVAGAEPAEVFVYDSGDKTAFTAGGAGIGNEIIRRAGGRNVFADVGKPFGDVSFEQVAARAPDVVVIYDYGDRSVADKKRFLLSHPALQDVPAIRNERFAVLPLSATVLGVRVPEGVDSLARQLHPDLFR